jgi:hypothetical protein
MNGTLTAAPKQTYIEDICQRLEKQASAIYERADQINEFCDRWSGSATPCDPCIGQTFPPPGGAVSRIDNALCALNRAENRLHEVTQRECMLIPPASNSPHRKEK